MTVAASILTHNSLPSLADVVRSVAEQTHPPTRLLVVDNGSDDGTSVWLAEHGDVEARVLASNEGVGAGHNAGISLALERAGCDFVWLLEHDSIPDPGCLGELLAAAEQLRIEGRSVGALMPFRRSGPDDPTAVQPSDLRPHPDTNFTFNGALVPRATFEVCGLLRTDYFVGLEDSEFAHRIRAGGAEILEVPRAHLLHLNKGPRRQRRLPSPSRSYYSTRNSLHFEVRIRRRRAARLVFVARAVAGSIRSVAFEDRKLRRVAARWTATIDGLGNRMGRRDYWFMRQNGA